MEFLFLSELIESSSMKSNLKLLMTAALIANSKTWKLYSKDFNVTNFADQLI